MEKRTLSLEEQVEFWKKRYFILNKSIDDFKEYDAKRKRYIEQLTSQVASLKEQRDKLMLDIDYVLSSINEAKPSILDPNTKAIYNRMMEKNSELRKENKKLSDKVGFMISEDINCDEVLLSKIEELKQIIKAQKNELSFLNKKIKNIESITNQ